MEAIKVPTEHEEQKAVIRWFDLQHAEHRGRLMAIPNGGERNVIVASRLKAEGVRKGVPDLMLPVARHGFHGLWIELKRLKGSKVSPEQAEWQTYLNNQGYMAVTCLGAAAAIETIGNYLRGR